MEQVIGPLGVILVGLRSIELILPIGLMLELGRESCCVDTPSNSELFISKDLYHFYIRLLYTTVPAQA